MYSCVAIAYLFVPYGKTYFRRFVLFTYLLFNGRRVTQHLHFNGMIFYGIEFRLSIKETLLTLLMS